MPFMQVQITARKPWIEIDTRGGTWVVSKEHLSRREIAAIAQSDLWEETFGKYAEDYGVVDVSEKSGFGVRLSAPGYMDATEWEVYATASEAAERAEELADEIYTDTDNADDNEEYTDFIKRLKVWAKETEQEEGSIPFDDMMPL